MQLPSLIGSFIINQLKPLYSITDGTDVEGTIEEIRQGVQIRGANIWILICSAMLASIGLDTNSSAVIIGAMLISPLMSPILGIGLSIGITDRDLLFLSLKNFTMAVFISLSASTIYFMLTPLGLPTTEMMARIKPTLLDVGVAVFGGIAGIVANSRRNKTNAIPGVAIATALMPPMCVAGYGLATWQAKFFWGAFYLFFINAVFISLSTYLIVRILRFPHREFLDNERKTKIQRSLLIFAVVIIVPSAIIFWNVIQEEKSKRNISQFVEDVVNSDIHEAKDWSLVKMDSMTVLKLYVIGEAIDSAGISEIRSRMNEYDLEEMTLRLVQMNVPQEEMDQIVDEMQLNIMKQIEMQQVEQKTTQNHFTMIIDSLNGVITNIIPDTALYAKVRSETQLAFPEIAVMDIATMPGLIDSAEVNIPVVFYSLDSKRRRSKAERELLARIDDYLRLRMAMDSIRIMKVKIN